MSMFTTRETSITAYASSLGGAPLEDAVQMAWDRDLPMRRLGTSENLTEVEALTLAATEPGLLVVVQVVFEGGLDAFPAT